MSAKLSKPTVKFWVSSEYGMVDFLGQYSEFFYREPATEGLRGC